MITIFYIPLVIVLIIWAGRFLHYSWAYRIGIPIDKIELPIQALDVRDPLDNRFFVLPKTDYLAIKESFFWYPESTVNSKAKGLHYNRAFLLRVFGTLEKKSNGKAVLTTVGWSPVPFILALSLLIGLISQVPNLSLEILLGNSLIEYLSYLIAIMIFLLCLKMAYDESKIVSDIIARRFRFALK